MGMKKQIKLGFQMDGRDIRLVKGLLGKILNLGQISLSLIFSLAMTVSLAISMKGSEAAAPLMIFSGLISVLFLTLLVYAAAIRPQLIQGLQSLEGQRGWVTFRNRDILVKVGNCPEVTVGYKALRGQYWCGEDYILYFDDKVFKNLLAIRIDKESFDDVYLLANVLQEHKKRFIQLKVKHKRGKEDEGKNIVQNE